ncbi:MAG TPA: PQQ-dependent sugar dehydrogenase [Verrucomicrobiae bacterium]|nr:PQQ-dependent sugar dehydrogenase [Verrucomicrobiae bacterium]
MKKNLTYLLVVIVGGVIIGGLLFYWYNLRGVGPVINGPPGNIADIIDNNQGSGKTENNTEFPLKVPESFSISVFARNVSGARMMEFDVDGNLWVSRTSQGRVTAYRVENGQVGGVLAEITGLRNPHGIAFDPQDPSVLYIAEEHQITKRRLSDSPQQKIANLPTQGGGHFTRTIRFGPDNRLYVSIGSSCNVCDESDPRRAAIYVMNKDGSDFKQYAKGLRNAVFFTWSDVDGRMWATEMGRDLLGDNIPPEEINIIEEGKNYGWPICYGNNIHDTNFDKKTYIRNPCMEPFETPPKVEMQAHSAPLGLAFVPEEGWPEDMWYDLIVAFHGSWNRSEPTGYKLVRIKLDEKGNYQGTEDFITGWLTKEGVLGRPVDVMIFDGGTMYVSDDKAGVIYKITYNRE